MSTQQLIEQARKQAAHLQQMVQTYPQMSEDEPGGYCTEVDQCIDEAVSMLRHLAAELEGVEQMNASLRSQNETLDAKLAELERLERKPLTQSAVELAFKESLATHYYDFVDGVRFAERAHHIGEGENHV